MTPWNVTCITLVLAVSCCAAACDLQRTWPSRQHPLHVVQCVDPPINFRVKRIESHRGGHVVFTTPEDQTVHVWRGKCIAVEEEMWSKAALAAQAQQRREREEESGE